MSADAPKMLSRDELREVLADFLLQGHLRYRAPGLHGASDYQCADAMIADLAAAGVAIVSAAHIAALEAERDAARTEADELRVKLRPFALWSQYQLDHELPAKVLADADTPVLGDVWSDQPEITVADLREAAAPPARREEV